MKLDRATIADGFYLSEPTFGRLVNTAKNLGFTLVPYEQRDDQKAPDDADRFAQIEARETAQSGNLAAFLAENPETKNGGARRPLPCGRNPDSQSDEATGRRNGWRQSSKN